jgi:DNA-binding NtrC family response regulator
MFSIELAKACKLCNIAQKKMPMNSATSATAKMRLLIVDDDVSLLDAMQRSLRDSMRTVVACDSFEKARQMLKDQLFDALITDVRLGAFNGLQLAVMARDMYPEMRLIVFSGFDDPVLRADAEQIGAVYLVKPVVSGELLKLLEKPPAN